MKTNNKHHCFEAISMKKLLFIMNPFAGQMVILSGAKTGDGAGDYQVAPAAAQPREEISVAEIGDDIPF